MQCSVLVLCLHIVFEPRVRAGERPWDGYLSDVPSEIKVLNLLSHLGSSVLWRQERVGREGASE